MGNFGPGKVDTTVNEDSATTTDEKPIPVFFAGTAPMDMTQAQTWCNQNVLSTDIKTFDELVKNCYQGMSLKVRW